MKKLFFTTGIIIVLIGAIATASYNTEVMYSKTQSAVYYTNNQSKNYTDKSWEVSGYFNKGEKLDVYCIPSANWSKGLMDEADDDVPAAHRHIYMDIVDPTGNATEFNTAWTDTSTSGTVPFAEVMIWVTNRTAGLFQPQNNPTYVGGVAALSGTYKAIVISEFEPSYSANEEPPYYLALDRESPYPTYPFGYLLPVGGSTMAVGAVISALSAKSKKKQKSRTAKT